MRLIEFFFFFNVREMRLRLYDMLFAFRICMVCFWNVFRCLGAHVGFLSLKVHIFIVLLSSIIFVFINSFKFLDAKITFKM